MKETVAGEPSNLGETAEAKSLIFQKMVVPSRYR
jgi:hypothetical protein